MDGILFHATLCWVMVSYIRKTILDSSQPHLSHSLDITLYFDWNFLALVMCSRPLHKRKLYVSYGVQLFLNFLWSFSFFYLESAFLGLVNIVLLLFTIVWNIYEFKRCSKWAAWLLYPYFLWVLYASTLNFAIWCLN